jgi:carboxyl-terminal processing protease
MKKHLLRFLPFSLLFLSCVYVGFYFSQSRAGWSLNVQSQEAYAKTSPADPSSPSNDSAYRLQDLTILHRAVVHVEDNYVAPKRINRRKMIGSALEEIQRVVPELMVNIKLDDQKVPLSAHVQVNNQREIFPLEMIENRYHLIFAFKDIFRFIQKNLKHFKKLRDIEYAAINGMLSTLDPHSILLTPEEYAEMRLSTRGRFGGLGIVIGIRDSQLTVINPIEDTPASRAGLQANDKIVQINLDSTVNMSLSDAVDMMRGEPGTSVDIFVMRDGWSSPKKFTLERANIKVKSAKWLSLGRGIGVVRVSNFQNTTVKELKAALKEIKKVSPRRRLRGLILDLRGNPGGLLDQAAKMVDLFIEEGTIVKTVGFGDKMREPKMANKRGTQTRLPIVVLVNASSASASEIVAGALKNHRRALIMGQRTFGKGSVQILLDNPDHSALKLTIAQYLTPGDISIQSVGVTPTVELSPVLLTEKETYFFGSPNEAHGEALLPEHLEHESSSVSKGQNAIVQMHYLQDAKLLKTQRDKPNEIIIDYEIELAKQILLNAKSPKLKHLLKATDTVMSTYRGAQQIQIDKQLRQRDIQWKSKVTKASARGVATVNLTPKNIVQASETLEITIEVKNTSKNPIHKLRGISTSESPLLKGHEFLFGHIPPGESRSWTAKVEVAPSALDRVDEMKISFEGDGKSEVPTLTTKVAVGSLPLTHFALRYELDDQLYGNGDGLLNPGEEVELLLSYKNNGKGTSIELVGHLSNEGKGVQPGLFIKRGRVTPEQQKLAPSESGELRFRFKVKESWRASNVSVFLSLLDPKLRESTSDKVTLPIRKADLFKVGRYELVPSASRPTAPLYVQPSGEAIKVARVERTISDGCVIEGDLCQWYRVKATQGLYHWANAKDFKVTVSDPSSTPSSTSSYISEYGLSPPQLSLQETVRESVASEERVSGQVMSVKPLQDLMIYVNNRKVYFLSKEEMSDPFALSFDAKVPLEPGVNRITVYARQSESVVSRKTIFITTPKKEKTRSTQQTAHP